MVRGESAMNDRLRDLFYDWYAGDETKEGMRALLERRRRILSGGRSDMAEARKHLKIWYDSEGDYLEVTFEQKAGYFRETESDRVMKKVDDEGHVLGFSLLGFSAMKENPLDVAL